MPALASIALVRDGERPRIERLFRGRMDILDTSSDLELISKYLFPNKISIDLHDLTESDVDQCTFMYFIIYFK